MTTVLACHLVALSASLMAPGQGAIQQSAIEFAAPVRVAAGGVPIQTETPGYASPAWHDVNGDGREDLVVGQYAGGKMSVYLRAEDGSFGGGEWLQAGGEVAQVAGVW